MGYVLHYEADTKEPDHFDTMKEIRDDQKRVAKECERTFKEICDFSYIMTDKEYAEEQAKNCD